MQDLRGQSCFFETTAVFLPLGVFDQRGVTIWREHLIALALSTQVTVLQTVRVPRQGLSEIGPALGIREDVHLWIIVCSLASGHTRKPAHVSLRPLISAIDSNVVSMCRPFGFELSLLSRGGCAADLCEIFNSSVLVAAGCATAHFLKEYQS